jgi:branched-subunit amino acid transport protein AzlD
MTLSISQSIMIIAVVALCTFATRVIPFLLFGGNKKVPDMVQYLGKVLPMAIMGTLVIYCLKHVSFATAGNFVPELVAVAVVVGLHLWRRNTLISIAGGTICYMLLVQLVF